MLKLDEVSLRQSLADIFPEIESVHNTKVDELHLSQNLKDVLPEEYHGQLWGAKIFITNDNDSKITIINKEQNISKSFVLSEFGNITKIK
ncbi:MAG: hypothetical protein Q7R33_04720 [Nitrosarchaeum sp.]|nr:hypothetical protein [Nitrosarchaeum sp.]